MQATSPRKLAFLPPAPGLCHVCATKHDAEFAHNFWSLYYQMHFLARFGREATHADTCAHLPQDQREIWREVVEETGNAWTVPPDGQEPIAEPYARHA